MTEYLDEKEASKAKKIRRILLLKIDRELKSDSNKNNHLNIMINSKKPQELNKAYNSYKILLSETSRVYSNYVEIIEKCYPNNKKEIKRKKESPRNNKEEQIIKSLNSSFESNIPYLDFIPSKIDLGKKKITMRRKNIKGMNSPNFFVENNLKGSKTKEDVKIKSTKPNKKGIVKVIDKIVKLKLNTDIGDDYNITKSIIKLRKYCYKLIKKRKKQKKTPKIKRPLSPQKPNTNDIFKKSKSRSKSRYKKRKTIVGTHNLISSLFGIKESMQDSDVSRKDTHRRVSIFSATNIPEKHTNETEKKILISKWIKTYKLSSFKEMKQVKYKDKEKDKDKDKDKEKDKDKDKDKEKDKEKYLSDKKRKLRRIQTLNVANVPTNSVRTQENKELNIKISQNTLSQFNNIAKEPIFSTKFTRPSKFVIINNNNIILTKKNSLFDKKTTRKKERPNVKFSEEIKEEEEKKRKSKPRKSFIRNGKNTVKIINSDFRRFKLFSE